MGESVDWLDVYNTAGGPEVAAQMRAAAQAPPVSPPPPAPPTDLDGADEPDFVPPPELVLPGQAGPRARLILGRLFHADGDHAWQLRRFGGQWYIYITGRDGLARWRPSDEEELRAAVRELLEGYWTRKWIETKGEWKYQRFAPTDRVVEDILRAAVHRVGVRADTVPCWLTRDFDEDGVEVVDRDRWRRDHVDDGPVPPAKAIAFRNGILDVQAWCGGGQDGEVRLLPHSPRWFSLNTLDTDLPLGLLAECAGDDDALAERLGALCPTWLNFVGEISGGSEPWIEALQRFVGYCLTPDISLDKILWIQGPPGTGKTTLVEGIEAAVGIDNTVYTDLDALSGRFGVAPLVGKLAAIIPEMHVGHMTNVAAALQRLKAISGGAHQQVEDKFMKSRSRVKMSVKFIVTPNEEPRMPDASAAIARRLVVLPVQYVPARADPGLSERLEAERAGIRVWALLGLRRLWADVKAGRSPFCQPEEGVELLEEIEAKSSPARHFVRECCVVGAGNSVAVDTLWQLWAKFREGEGYAEMSNKQTFGGQMRAAVPGLRRVADRLGGDRAYVYTGVRPVIDEHDRGEPLARVRYSDGYLEEPGHLVWDDPRTPV